MQKPEKKTNTDGNRAKVCERVETNKTPPTHTHATLPNLDDPLKPLPPSIPGPPGLSCMKASGIPP